MKKKVEIKYNSYMDNRKVKVQRLPNFLALVTDGNPCNDHMELADEVSRELENTREVLGKLIEILVLKGNLDKGDLEKLLNCWKYKINDIDIKEDTEEIDEEDKEILKEHGIL